jgi:hypothetical protein
MRSASSAITDDRGRRFGPARSAAAHAGSKSGRKAPIRRSPDAARASFARRRGRAGDPPVRGESTANAAEWLSPTSRAFPCADIRTISFCRASGNCGTISRPMTPSTSALPKRSTPRCSPAIDVSPLWPAIMRGWSWCETLLIHGAPRFEGALHRMAEPAGMALKRWRRGRDSNPRYGCPYAAFRVRCDRPLCHLSKPLKLLHNQ